LLAGAMLRNAMLKDINAKNGEARREAAGCGISFAQVFEVKPAAGLCRHRADRTSYAIGS